MKKVVDSTDNKHIGDYVDESSAVVTFRSGETMEVEKRLHDNRVLANSNYVIILED